MTSIPPFHQRFNLKIDQTEAHKRFCNRINNGFTQLFYGEFSSQLNEAKSLAATSLGEICNSGDPLGVYFSKSFIECLQVVEGIYNGYRSYPSISREINRIILGNLSRAEYDLGVKWRDGYFQPSGAKLLDDFLVNENLKWLDDPELKHVYDPFNKALLHYSESIKHPETLKDVITDMYEALEATAMWFLGNDKDLSGNREQFIGELKLPDSYKRILKEYISYANDFSRHAKKPDEPSYPVPPSEAENFIYLTGLFIRFAIQRKKEG